MTDSRWLAAGQKQLLQQLLHQGALTALHRRWRQQRLRLGSDSAAQQRLVQDDHRAEGCQRACQHARLPCHAAALCVLALVVCAQERVALGAARACWLHTACSEALTRMPALTPAWPGDSGVGRVQQSAHCWQSLAEGAFTVTVLCDDTHT